MKNINKTNSSFLENKINKVIKEKGIILEDKHKSSLEKAESKLTPLVFFVLLVVIPIFNIFKIKTSSIVDFLIGTIVAFILAWLWYKTFRSLAFKNIISLWMINFMKTARNVINSKNSNYKSKSKAYLFTGILFSFMGTIFLVNLPGILLEYDNGMEILFYIVLISFLFLGFWGISNYMIIKKPERIISFLRNNRKINFLIVFILSLYCFLYLSFYFNYFFLY